VFVECQMESFKLSADGIQNYTWLIHSVGKATAGSGTIIVRPQRASTCTGSKGFYLLWRM
jgi:hypothetical protein